MVRGRRIRALHMAGKLLDCRAVRPAHHFLVHCFCLGVQLQGCRLNLVRVSWRGTLSSL